MIRQIIPLLFLLLFAGQTFALDYEIKVPCETEEQSVVISEISLRNVRAEVGLAYQFPEGLSYIDNKIEGANQTAYKVDGNTYKWTFKPTGDAKITTTFKAQTPGEKKYYVFLITPPGTERREEKTIMVTSKPAPVTVEDAPEQTVVQEITPEAIPENPEEKSTFWVQLIVCLMVAGAIYSMENKDREKKEETINGKKGTAR